MIIYKVTYAKFGRWEYSTCNRENKNEEPCSNIDIITDASSNCNGKSTCEYQPVWGANFIGDPCPGVYKYIKLLYKCISQEGKSKAVLLYK